MMSGLKLGSNFYERNKKRVFSETLIIGISSSGISSNIKKHLNLGKVNIKTALITGMSPSEKISTNTIVLGVNEYIQERF